MLFEPYNLADLELRNRVVMAPMTRCRANTLGVLSDITTVYYGQRASAGFMVTEGTHPCAEGQGIPRTPGIYTQEQINAWEKVTRTVHQKGSHIFVQLMHAGRVAHSLNRIVDTPPVAPSAVQVNHTIFTDQLGMVPMEMPEALTRTGIKQVIDSYANAARNALKAGFDGVELHCASGTLPQQFMSEGSNFRTDEYGGSIQNRIRFILEVVDAMIGVTKNSHKVAVRISPGIRINDINEVNPLSDYPVLMKELSTRDIAYVNTHLMPIFMSLMDEVAWLRSMYDGNLIASGGFNKQIAQHVLEQGYLNCIGFGKHYVSNPDLVMRMRLNQPIVEPNMDFYYTPGEHGYIDYPEIIKTLPL